MGADAPPGRLHEGRPSPVAAYCTVAVDSPVLALDRPFDYRIPQRLAGRVRVGCVVRVPLHGRRMRAFVTAISDVAAVPNPSSLSALVSDEPLFGEAEIACARWAADRYVSTLGAVLHSAVPGRFSAPSVKARPVSPAPATAPPEWLDRPAALADVVTRRRRAVVLAPDEDAEIDAVVHAAGSAGGRTLVIAPRVELAERVAAAMTGAVVLHSGMSPARRARAWAIARDGGAPVIAGGRAAILAPVSDLALVAVLAAHDRSLKEERSPKLHALVVAMRRAATARAALVACSPSPPLDMAGPHASRYTWLDARARGRAVVRPEIASPRGGPVTSRLIDVVRGAVAGGGVALVFTARKGLALRVRCEECGWYPRCDRCGAGLALFGSADGQKLRCRSCGKGAAPRSTCPDCNGRRLDGVGWGTERLAATLAAQDLGAPLVRVEAGRAVEGELPSPAVVVGTHAAMWGLPVRPAAIAVADLDQMLGLPDFRAAERAFQTLRELSGMLAPGGRFLVQTREPEHHVVQAFVRGSFKWFAQRELPTRRDAGYPPFGVVVRVECGPDATAQLSRDVRAAGGELVGPLERPDGRSMSLLRATDLDALRVPLRGFATRNPDARIDVDPVDVL